MAATKETLGFQTEVRQLLQLMIHSLYSNREIFLRELISNASDACDKLRYEALDRPELYEGDSELQIRVDFDRDARSITISDNGIGLTREEAIEHLGTIARSGTREFFGRLSGDEAKDAQLIGQFGVGFYSSFIVADRVSVVSRRAGAPINEAVLWESDGSGEFSVETVDKPERGTAVTLHLRPDDAEAEGESFSDLLSSWRLKAIITRYSDHISLPILMRREEWDKDKNEMRRLGEWETVNQASALWTRPKAEITDEQYRNFYKHLSHDDTEPLAWTHNRVEGRTEYIQLLYLPSKAPFDLGDRQRRAGLKLYVRRVFIMDDAEQLLPVYLRFVRGVVDSSDLPLNISREILQESRDVKAIREGCARRVLSMLEDLAENQPEKYATFWSEFGQVFKEGVGEDFGNRERIAKLLRFTTSQSEGSAQTVSLADYLGRMKEGQDKIWYLTADSVQAARSSPHLEVFRRKGIEVLLLADRVDEWMLSFLDSFESHELSLVARGDLDLGKLEDEAEKTQAREAAEEFRQLTERVKASLGDSVKEVRITNRLTDSAACLVSDEGEISGHLERLLKQAGQKAPERKPILEINPQHPLVAKLNSELSGDDVTRVTDWSRLLLDQAQLAEGGQIEDPAGFVQRLNRMLLSISPGVGPSSN